ncbi:50S ribosomal protein L2 [Rickettsiales endosymbiont of Peranema trichophorum]|uniref:50S ribosomal protein L2 n=1 Tax=Rickettsiales endosymbiont of Peranema trichophorum TaxID=2486577 RepID=UPI0010239D84|nr:50S ribosomal protein L2 [Rickettsiales endosymbiont of Peranema trichophorum]RZI45562.1 50S ribosomal protein L2 [Rickettsiales endosymbiont of Peranema trichophorum]
MALKKYSAVTAGTRQLVLVDRSGLWKGRPVRELVVGKNKSGGRNNSGRTTAWRKSGGHKQKYRVVDFVRNKNGISATVERLEYDPNRSAFIALIRYDDGVLSYILAPQKLSVGDKVMSGEGSDIRVGNALPLKRIPVGTIVHNVELKPGKGGQLARAGGSYAQLVGKDADNVLLRLRSGEVRMVLAECSATIGAASNPDNQNVVIGKAGRNRWLGVKPSVRGIAMNPVDHPHGGRTNGGRHPVTPWGVSTKGKRTRRNKRTSRYIVKRRYN